MENRFQIWAHRGGKITTPPGNTYSAFERAYSLGVDGIETDLCYCYSFDRQDKTIIYHPGSFRLDLVALDWEAIKLFYKGIILDLDSFLNFLRRRNNLKACLEIKIDCNNLLREVVSKVTACGLENRVYITAPQCRIPGLFKVNGEFLLKAKQINSKIKTHLIVTFPYNLPGLVQKYKVDAVSFGWLPGSVLSKVFFQIAKLPFLKLENQVEIVKRKDVLVWGGIVNSKKDMEYFWHLGVQGIFTDDIRVAIEFKKNKGLT